MNCYRNTAGLQLALSPSPPSRLFLSASTSSQRRGGGQMGGDSMSSRREHFLAEAASVAFVTARRAGPVIDDQGDADQ